MSQHGVEALPTDEELVRMLIEVLIALWEGVPFVVWLVIAFFIIHVLRRRSSDQPPTTRQEPDRSAEPAREKYSIHDDLDASPTEYRQPSEDDEIVVTNEVDRSLIGAIRRLTTLGRQSRERRD